MKISDSNPIQFWLAGRIPFNDVEIYGIDKKLFYQSVKVSGHHRTDVKFDKASAPTWDATVTYELGDLVYLTTTGLRYISIEDGNLNNDPNLGILFHWNLEVSAPDYISTDVYKVGNIVKMASGGWHKYKALVDQDFSTAHYPPDLGGFWELVVENQSVFKMLAYVGDVYNQEFLFLNVRTGAPNQFVEFDYSVFTLANNQFLRLKIFSTTITPFIKPPSAWTDLTSSWNVKDATSFQKNSYTGTLIKSYQPCFAKAGSKLAISFRVSMGTLDGGQVSVGFAVTDELNVIVSTQTAAIISGTGVFNFTKVITLTADCTRLAITLQTPTFVAGLPDIAINQIVGVNVVDVELAQSDCIEVKESYNSSVLIEYTNLTDYDGIAYRDTHPVNKLLIQPAHFWEQQDPREEENYADSKGDVITLKTKIEKQVKLSVAYFTAYMHTKLAHIFNHDFIRIDGVIYKGRAAYTPVPIERSTLYAGNVWLTEQGSVLVNIGGQITGESGGIFDDSFDDSFE